MSQGRISVMSMFFMLLLWACLLLSPSQGSLFNQFRNKMTNKLKEKENIIEPKQIDNWEQNKELIRSTIDLLSPLATGLMYIHIIKLLAKTVQHTLEVVMNQLNKSSNQPILHDKNIQKFFAVNNTSSNQSSSDSVISLDPYELEILSSLVDPDNISSDFNDIGGNNDIKDDLRVMADVIAQYNGTSVVTKSSLFTPVDSYLFYGPPGCGKTLIAKAFAKLLNTPILVITPSLLLRKYIGETSLLTKAIHSLAKKLTKVIIFIDEMDALFRSRNDNDNSVDRNIKTEFMTIWDEIKATSNSKIMVIACTNRPDDLDPAILRRFERSYLVAKPDISSRIEIFKIILNTVQCDAQLNYQYFAERTEGYSASDIHALCKLAVQKHMKENKNIVPLPPLSNESIKKALDNYYPTSWSSTTYSYLRDENNNGM